MVRYTKASDCHVCRIERHRSRIDRRRRFRSRLTSCPDGWVRRDPPDLRWWRPWTQYVCCTRCAPRTLFCVTASLDRSHRLASIRSYVLLSDTYMGDYLLDSDGQTSSEHLAQMRAAWSRMLNDLGSYHSSTLDEAVMLKQLQDLLERHWQNVSHAMNWPPADAPQPRCNILWGRNPPAPHDRCRNQRRVWNRSTPNSSPPRKRKSRANSKGWAGGSAWS